MSMNDFHTTYPNRNAELRALVKQCFEFGRTVAREPSAAHSSGMDEHGIRRQLEYIDHAENMVAALASKPIPDQPIGHDPIKEIDLSIEYDYFIQDLEGNEVPLNEYTQLLAEQWLIFCAELARSQSAAIAGSLVTFDEDRANTNLGVIAKLVAEIQERPALDLPETALPGAKLGNRSGGKKK